MTVSGGISLPVPVFANISVDLMRDPLKLASTVSTHLVWNRDTWSCVEMWANAYCIFVGDFPAWYLLIPSRYAGVGSLGNETGKVLLFDASIPCRSLKFRRYSMCRNLPFASWLRLYLEFLHLGRFKVIDQFWSWQYDCLFVCLLLSSSTLVKVTCHILKYDVVLTPQHTSWLHFMLTCCYLFYKSSCINWNLHTHVAASPLNQSIWVTITTKGTCSQQGQAGHGGRCNVELQEVVEVVSNNMAFAAITRHRSVVTWGNAECGGVISEGLKEPGEEISAFLHL